MNASTLDAIIERSCRTKVAYGAKRARTVADQLNRQQKPNDRRLHAYRCPFTEHEHWHVGHQLSIAGMHELAAAIRFARYPNAHPKGAVA